MKKILLAIDNSMSALNAAIYGIELAQKFDLEIGIAEITKYSTGNIPGGVMPIEAEKVNQQRAKTYIDEIRQVYPSLIIEEFVPIGNPEVELKKIIKLWEADLLVIGHHKHDIFHKLFSKSIEAELIATIEIPIIIVPEEYKLNKPVQRNESMAN